MDTKLTASQQKIITALENGGSVSISSRTITVYDNQYGRRVWTGDQRVSTADALVKLGLIKRDRDAYVLA